jgi:myosin heavy subunit
MTGFFCSQSKTIISSIQIDGSKFQLDATTLFFHVECLGWSMEYEYRLIQANL